MTPTEFEYLKRAVEELDTHNYPIWQRAKILRTISQITGRAAAKYEHEFQEQVDQNLERNRLIDTLKK